MNYKALPLIISLLLHGILFGQNSQAFKYQAVARDGSGHPIIDQDISLQIKIYTLNGGNQDDYVENHFVSTNNFGLVNIEIGNGEIVEGDFQSIDWGIGNQFIEISIDISGGENFVFMGSSEILSVPMANYAARAGNVVDTSVTNELQKLTLDHQHMLELNPEGDQVDLSLYYNLDEIDSLGQKITQDSIYFENELEALNLAIQNETIRAISEETELYSLIDENALNILADSIYFQNLIDGINAGGNDDSLYFQTLIDNNTLKIINDSAFLKSLIDANNLAIQQEITRAILAEAINATNISLNSSLINQLANDLLNDSIYLKGLIDQNTLAITTEITRAISAELQNSMDISQNTTDILNNSIKILNDSVFFKNLIDQVDYYLQEEITRATYRDETISDSVIYLYSKQISDSTYFQNLIDGLSGGGLDPTLDNGKIFVGNTSNVATGVYLSGDAQMTNTGFLMINPNAITTTKIANGNVTNNKLAFSYLTLTDEYGNTGDINLGSELKFEALGAANLTYDNNTNKLSISSTDNQILSVSGSDLLISSGNSVDLSTIIGQTGPQGPQGPAGNNGVGITSTINNGDGSFTINYSDGSSFTSADLTGPQGAIGPQGPVGPQGLIGPVGNDGVGVASTVDNGNGTFTINYTNGSSFTSADLTGPQGAQGPVGPQGAIGPAGINGVGVASTLDNGNGTFTINYTDGSSFTSSDLTGPQGAQGPVGPQGAIGPAGLDGVGVASTVDNGDGSFTINYTDGSSFTSLDLTGPQGIQGPQGPIGPQGVIGPPGPNGNDGVGISSSVDNGDGSFTINYTDGSSFTSSDLTGPQGPNGNDGIDGVSINWYGTVFPAPSSPSLNDGYHDPVSRKSFIWNGSVWLTISEDGIQGPQGPTGPQGPAGTSLRDCPSTGSWSQINEEFCIEVNENTAETWWNAAAYCGDQNAHLCSWQEWFYVCQKSGSGTINMTNDWEWTGEGQSGSPSNATVVGNGSCTGSNSESMSNTNTFRCCFSR